jgi:hypothetical protein
MGVCTCGGEQVRNVSTKTKKLRYTLPKTRYFCMAFPLPVELRSSIPSFGRTIGRLALLA